MAIYSFHLDAIQRSKGGSALSSGAYVMGIRARDERTGTIADYRRRRGVLARSDRPIGWDGDVESLLVEMEKREARKNSITGRKIVLALPHELHRERQIRLVDAATKVFGKMHGCAGIWAIHAPDRKGDPRNFHAHIIISARRVDGGARLGEKTRELDDMKSGGMIIEAWRKAWAILMTDELREIGIDKHLEHRSHRRIGKAEIPKRHLGHAATAIERRGKRSYIGATNREIDRINKDGRVDKKSPTKTKRTRLAPKISTRQAAVVQGAANNNTNRGEGR